MAVSTKPVRRSISLPPDLARQVHRLAKARRLSENRLLADLIQAGIADQRRRHREFTELAERFRAAQDPAEAARLGDQLGQLVFG